MSTNTSHPKHRTFVPHDKPDALDQDADDIFVDSAPRTTAEDGSEDDVKLTEISAIVAKYAVVDKVFDEDDGDDAEDSGDREDDAFDNVADAASDDDAYEAYDPADTELPERPKIVFRRPRMLRDEIYSNWSDNAEQAVDDIKTSYLRDASPDLMDEPEEDVPPPSPLSRERLRLMRSVAVSVGVPIVGGALFALVLYMQNDVKTADTMELRTTNASTTVQTDTSPTPNFAQHPELRQETKETTTVAGLPSEPDPASPESGINRAVPNDDDRAQTTGATETTATPQSSPNPVYMARLTVSDTEGSSLSPIPLSLAVAPGVPEQRLRIRISGLPNGAVLSNGSDLGNGEWLLREPDLENLNMTLAPGFSGQITLLAEVIDDATHIQAAPSKMVAVNVTPDKMVVQPAAAPPDNPPQSFAEPDEAEIPVTTAGPTPIVPQNSPFAELRVEAPDTAVTPDREEPKVAALTPPVQIETPAEAAPAAPAAQTPLSNDGGLIAKGDELMNNGDISAARLFYQRALKTGDARAATAIGKSYDPVIFQQLKVHGVLPDPTLAIEWYRKGAQGGDSTATARIQALNDWLKR